MRMGGAAREPEGIRHWAASMWVFRGQPSGRMSSLPNTWRRRGSVRATSAISHDGDHAAAVTWWPGVA